MVIIPNNYEEALDLLQDSKKDILAGGTDVMVKKRNWAGLSPKLTLDTVCIFNLGNLQYVYQDNKGLHIGSMTRLENLLHNPLVYVPLKTAIEEMASPAIRHVATIGGNIGNASPAGDTLPILYVYDTIIVLESIDGLRKVPIDEYIIGPGQTTKKDNELIKEIIIKDIDYKSFYYEKVGGRRSDAISKLSFIGLYSRNKQGAVNDIRIAFGSVYKTVVRSRSLEKSLVKAINEEEARHLINEPLSQIVSLISEYSIQTVIDKYDKRILPIDDQRSNAKYRKACSISLLKSFLNMIGGD